MLSLKSITYIYKHYLSNKIMKKKIKKWGNSLVVVFDKEDIELHGLVEGDWVDLRDMLIQKGGKKKW